MIRIGITGVMGAGKSSVAGVLNMLGAPLYDCDSRAKELINSRLRSQIIELFGSKAYLPNDGELDRAYVASAIFSDMELKESMEQIVHPALHCDLVEWLEENSDARYVLIESAILLGSVVEGVIDKLLVVYCDESEIYERVALRSGLTNEQIEARLRTQMSQKELVERADFTLFTAKNEMLVPKVVELNEKLLSLPFILKK